MFHSIEAKLVFYQLLHSPRAKRLELAHSFCHLKSKQGCGQEGKLRGTYQGFKVLSYFSRQNFVRKDLCGDAFFVCKAL